MNISSNYTACSGNKFSKNVKSELYDVENIKTRGQTVQI